jgi:hypothetical protein
MHDHNFGNAIHLALVFVGVSSGKPPVQVEAVDAFDVSQVFTSVNSPLKIELSYTLQLARLTSVLQIRTC